MPILTGLQMMEEEDLLTDIKAAVGCVRTLFFLEFKKTLSEPYSKCFELFHNYKAKALVLLEPKWATKLLGKKIIRK